MLRPRFAWSFALVLSLLASPLLGQCVTVTHPNPSGGYIDLAEWMTMDASLRYSNHLDPGEYGSLTWGNKIIWTKFNIAAGNNWDQYTFDDDYVYMFLTGTPTDFWVSATETSAAYGQRYPLLGYPGTRLVNACNQYKVVTQCQASQVYSSNNVITELWGPYSENWGGNIGTLDTVTMVYYWDCNGTTPDACNQMEVNSYVRPYGWVEWLGYQKVGGQWQYYGGGPFNYIEAGGPGYTNWCWN